MIETIDLKDIKGFDSLSESTIVVTNKPQGAIFKTVKEEIKPIPVIKEVSDDKKYSKHTYDGISKEWQGDVWIITGGEFMALLTGQEYAVYCGLNTIKYHNGSTDEPVNYLWENQLKYSYLAEELQLHGGKNKAGEDATVSRQTIGRLVNSLINKGVLTKKKIKIDDREVMQYILVSAKNELFTKIERPLLKELTTRLKGQVIKTYAYIKAMYELSLKNGNDSLNISRTKIAKAINEVSKNGDIGERQLKNITMYITILYNLNLVTASVEKRQNSDNTYSSYIKVLGIKSKLKDLPLENRMKVDRGKRA